MKNLSLLLITALIIGCTTIKTTQKKLNSGSYDAAIEDALKKLRPNKSKKSSQPYVFLLQEAYEKAQKRDQDKLRQFQNSPNYLELKSLYYLYDRLDRRQKKIEPILPLTSLQSGREVRFSRQDYFPALEDSKNRWATALFSAVSQQLEANSADKFAYRSLFDAVLELQQVRRLTTLEDAMAKELQFRGTIFVQASINNDTDQILPEKLATQLLDIPTGTLQNRWAIFHQKPQENTPYEYEVKLNFESIDISPEKIQEQVFESEKEIEDGTTILKDEDGNQVKDSLGNAIEVPRFKTVRSVFYQSLQQKFIQVKASLVLQSVSSQETISKFPLETQWVFEHRFGTFKGDRRALKRNWLRFLQLKQRPFPSNEEMLLGASKDIKREFVALLQKLPL